jgi:hypothetical protein
VYCQDASSNTEGSMEDITTANETILTLINEVALRDKTYEELEAKYSALKEKVIQNYLNI